ncbi:MAG: hypothetical protein ACPG7F_13790 [Aggregatilineales bacterium]
MMDKKNFNELQEKIIEMITVDKAKLDSSSSLDERLIFRACIQAFEEVLFVLNQ